MLTLALALVLTVSGTAVLVMAGHLLLPFQRLTTLEGRLASKAEFFEDEQVTRILLEHGIRVHTVSSGSREVATGSLEGYDFVFPSGEPAGDLISSTRQKQHRYTNIYRPFDSPLVLATYREYAKALWDAGAARPQAGSGTGEPLYYSLDMNRFLALTEHNRRWNDLGIGKYGVSNGNVVLAQTSDICDSNSAGTYLGLVAFTRNGDDVPTSTRRADELSAKLRPLLIRQGSPGADLFPYYASPNGRRLEPVVVVYEHQFLAYQALYRATHHTVDTERVLLYPTTRMLTQPQFIALDRRADRLGELLDHDPELQRRATELGYHVLGADALTEHLRQQDVPAPQAARDETAARMPDLAILERMIAAIKNCPAPATN
ncbi:hypothetical protein [Streptomyces orinoci]|uniref:Secreted protein n=1 Tax=Streptomyces orinoci TaxID=67339 RepID=A0ABV3K0R0_STRON|nr:hypothetical protein [Streptomyces orinoci]